MALPEISFEWDPQKATANLRKHGISFERAASVFRDSEAMTIFDQTHSRDEDRWITMGLDNQGSIVIVSHTWREADAESPRCRIISARRATANETRQYQNR